MARKQLILALVLFSILSINVASAATVTLYATKDCVCSTYPPISNLNSEALTVGMAEGYYYVSLVQFNLSSIPSGAVINSATLCLWGILDNGLGDIRVQELDGSWSETGVTWTNMPDGNGDGAISYIPAPHSDWDCGNVTDHVRAWHSGTRTNYGFQLFPRTSVNNLLAMFYNREVNYNRPYLVVDYTPTNVRPSIDITQPSSNITVNQGDPVSISWNGTDPDDAATVALFYDSDCDGNNGGWGLIALNQPEDGSYNWDTDGVPLGTYRIHAIIDDQNHGADVGTDCADGSVTIINVKPSIDVTQPSSNITVNQGETVSISWNGTDPDDEANVLLVYDSDCDGNNGGWELIAYNQPEDGSYNWDTDGVPLGTYRIHAIIDDQNHGADVGTDCADGSVTIGGLVPPEISITSPTSLSSWEIGTTQQINWTLSGGLTDHITIRISRDGGVTFESEPIANFDYQGIDEYDWMVTDPASMNCKIKIIASGPEGSGTAISDEFKLVGKPGFFVHITDLHVAAGSNQGWPEKIATIRDMNPAFVVATGDIVQWGFDADGAANYTELLDPLHGSRGNWFIDDEMAIPIYFCPGNHDAYQWDFDHVENWSEGEDDCRRRGFSNYVDKIGSFYYSARPPTTNITLFSLSSGMDEDGQADLCPESEGLDEYNFGMLQSELQAGVENGRGKIVMMHHPHLDLIDGVGMGGRFMNRNQDFMDLCEQNEVEVALCGHIHTPRRQYHGELPYRSDGTVWDINTDADQTAFVVTRELKNENGEYGFYRRVDFDANGRITAIGGNIEFPYSGVEIVKMSPVDLIVTDPSGATIDRWSSTIENASYEMYELTPGDTGATVYILHPLEGVYHIEVTPMANAAPTDDYSLYFANGSDTVCLAQDSLISSIPEEGYEVTVSSPSDVEDGDQSPVLPEKAALDQNYPNPFNPSTEIGFDLPRPSFVSLDIYDVLGRKVSTLINEHLTAGSKRVQWDGRNDAGAKVTSGVYFYRLRIGDHVEVKKMVLLK